jgi:seryl-tRNA synthetase
MFDLKDIRQRPEEYDANWARRGLEPQTPAILELDAKRRAIQTELQDVQNERNTKSKEIGQIKSQGGDAGEIMNEVAALKDRMAILEDQERELSEKLNSLLSSIPNQLADDVPDGADEDDNVEVSKFKNTPDVIEGHPDHVEIGERLAMMDFEVAAKVAGSRFVVLKGALARLDRALAQFMLDTHTTDHGYTEIQPPLLVSSDVMYGTTQLPKFEDDQFQTTDGRWLLPTSEVVLTNLVREEILDNFNEPLRFTAYTPCFRKEAGSAGRDTRGMIRQHQFYKVEMVSITKPEDSEAEHERMTGCAEAILKKLDLPYRKVVLCSGDIGFAARKTYDLEVWIPAQGKYREISSCSNCGDIQARRMNARYRPDGGKGTEFVHTLNGSGLAVGRTLVAVMENYWDEDTQSIIVPEVLKPYMGGIDRIKAG